MDYCYSSQIPTMEDIMKKEELAMKAINLAHNNKGMFLGSEENIDGTIGLQFKFEFNTGIQLFKHRMKKDGLLGLVNETGPYTCTVTV